MADGDDGVTEPDIDEDSFLTGVSQIDDAGFSSASGIDVGRVARAIAGTVVFTLALGVNTIVGAATQAYAGLINGASDFLAGSTTTEYVAGTRVETETSGLIGVVFQTGTEAIRGAWAFNLDAFGVFAYPVAVAVLMGTFIVVSRGIRQIQEVA